MKPINQIFNRIIENAGCSEGNNDHIKPVAREISKESNPRTGPKHHVSTSDPELIKNKKLYCQDDSPSKKGSGEKQSSQRNKVSYSLKTAEKSTVDSVSSNIKLIKFRKLAADEVEVGPEVHLEMDQDFLLKGKKLSWRWGGKKCAKLNTSFKTPDKLLRIAITKFRNFSETEMETIEVQIHKTEKPTSRVFNHRKGQRYRKADKIFQFPKKCQCSFCDFTS